MAWQASRRKVTWGRDAEFAANSRDTGRRLPRHLAAPVRASARNSLPELKPGFFLLFDAERLAKSQPCASVGEPHPEFNTAVNVSTGPFTRQQSPRVPNAGAGPPAPLVPPGFGPPGWWNSDFERIVVVACPVEPIMRRVFSSRDAECRNVSCLRSSRRLPSSERLSHSVAVVAHPYFIRSPSGTLPGADRNTACCSWMMFQAAGPIC